MNDDGDLGAGDPYRSPGDRGFENILARCPRCHTRLLSKLDEWLVCPICGGVWIPKANLRGILELDRLDAFVPEAKTLLSRLFPPAACAQCGNLMAVRVEHEVTFDFCPEDGVWLDAGERASFEAKCANGGWR